MELADLEVDAIAVLIKDHKEGQDDEPAKEADIELAKRILKDAKEYTESLTRLEAMEESAIQNL
jgi:hypothetical protein